MVTKWMPVFVLAYKRAIVGVLSLFAICVVHASGRLASSEAEQFDRAAAAGRIEARLAAERVWNEQYSPLRSRRRAGEDVEAQIKSLGEAPQFIDLEPDALRVIDADPTDAIAFAAIRVALRNNPMRVGRGGEWARSASGKLHARLAPLLLRYHLGRPEFLDAASRIHFSDRAETIEYWQKILAVSPNRNVRGQAALELMSEYFKYSTAAGLSDRKRESLRAEVTRYAKVIGSDYADMDLDHNVQKTLAALTYSVGVTLPDAQVATVAGGADSLAHYRGRVVLLEFWATWCSWCRKGQPELAALRKEMSGRPFEIISVSVDETPDLVTRYMAKEFKLPWPQWYVGPNGPLLKEWGVQAYPTYLLLDGRGVIQARSSGGFALAPLKEQVQGLVAEIEQRTSG